MSCVEEHAPRPGTSEWRKAITASKIPTILGLNPYQTASELWMVMSGLAQPEELVGDHLEWGHYAEDSLAKWWQHKNPGWQLNAGEVAYKDESLSFPNIATIDRRARRGRRFHIIECKTSDSHRIWDESGDLPGHVYAQALAQMGISGIHEASVVSQKGSTVPRIYEVEWDQELWDGIVPVLADFHTSLGNSEPPIPPLDLLDAMADAAKQPPSEDEAEADPELVESWIDLQHQKHTLQKEIDDLEKTITATTDAKRITHEGKVVASFTAGRFSQKNIGDDHRHLLKDPEVCTAFNAKAFATKYPDIHQAATGAGTYRFTPKPFL